VTIQRQTMEALVWRDAGMLFTLFNQV